jgi:hypothetical protein
MFVKNFDNFQEDSSLDEGFDFFDFLGKTFDIAGDALASTIKQKVVALMMEKLGILENSLLSEFLQQCVSTIDIAEWPGILFGENGGVKYFAPKMAEAIQLTLQKKGLDTIFKTFGVDSNGFLARTLLNAINENESREKIEKFILYLFGEDLNIGAEVVKSMETKDKELLNNAMFKAASKTPNFNLEKGLKSYGEKNNDTAGILSGLLG